MLSYNVADVMTGPDLTNGLFEVVGGLLCWFNVRKLYLEKRIVGIYWPVQAFFSIWGIWNLFYYSNLDQRASFYGGVFLVIGNTTWVLMAMCYSRKRKSHEES